jgi:mannose-6-phosphate isomerase
VDPARVGEVWLTADENRVTNGSWSGTTLGDLCRGNAAEFIGTAIEESEGGLFPLLVKFLFTSDKLSVQVHPSDQYARQKESSAGKSEMWHILKADAGARLSIGLRKDLSGNQAGTERLREAARTGEIEQLLNWMPVRPGDSFFIPAGTVHALGAGLTVCEIQQNSDVTYRLYDYNRLGTDGRPRQLHLEKGFSVLDRETRGGRVIPLEHTSGDGVRLCLAACPQFVTEKLTLTHQVSYPTEGTFEIWIGLEGTATLEGAGSRSTCSPGEVVIIPAGLKSFSVLPEERCVLLRTHPPKAEADPGASWRRLGFSETDLSRICFSAI